MSDKEMAERAFKNLDDNLKITHNLCKRIITMSENIYADNNVRFEIYNKCVFKYLDKVSVERAAYWHHHNTK